VQEIVEGDGAVQKVDAAAAMTVGDVFKEWVVKHLSTLSEGYRRGSVRRLWEQLFRCLAGRQRPAWVGTEVGTESTADVPSCPLAAFAKIAVLQESQLPSRFRRGPRQSLIRTRSLVRIQDRPLP